MLTELKKDIIVPVQTDKNLYCVCQQYNDGKLYIICSTCDQSYHPKCVNYNVINNHAIMKRDYKCGYCSKSKNWPDLSSQPPLPVVASTFGMIRPAVLHNAIRGRQQYQVILRAKPIVIHVDHRRREDGGGFWTDPAADKTCFKCSRLCVGEIVNSEFWCHHCGC